MAINTINGQRVKLKNINGSSAVVSKKKSALGNTAVLIGGTKIWTIDQLPDLYVGDILAFGADPGFQHFVVSLQHATTFHWAIVGERLDATDTTPLDYQIIGSINKGIATENLSAYQFRQMRVYRIKGMSIEEQILLRIKILYQCGYYGAYQYNWLGVAEAAIIFLLKEIGIKLHLGFINHRFYCIQFDARLWSDIGYDLVQDWQFVTPYDMETTPKLKIAWSTF